MGERGLDVNVKWRTFVLIIWTAAAFLAGFSGTVIGVARSRWRPGL